MLFLSLLLILLASTADYFRGESHKFISAIALGIAFGLSAVITEHSLIQVLVSVLIIPLGFYATAITTPRPLFAALHGNINPDEWDVTPLNKWMYSLSMKLASPLTQAVKFSIIYGACRGLYCLAYSIPCALIFQNPLIAPIGILGSTQGLCYYMAGKILPDNEKNAGLARLFFGGVQGLILFLILTLS